MAPRTPTAAGTLLGGRYQVLKHLASGGMAEVHLARATGIGGFERYVVIKQILAEHARDQRFVTMFLDEARLAAQLHHTNIAQVYDIGEEGGTYFFAMEYVHGEDVRTLLRKLSSSKRWLPTEHALGIVAGAAAGLHYAHDKRGADRQPLGLVHRDVSPSNVLVAYDGAVKLVDFGIAKAASRATETRSGTLKGKVAYMSPEQCLGKAIDRRSDVFALGIVLYELTTLTRLFKFENDYVTMHQIVTGEVPPPSKRRADYPAGLEPIVMKCLAREPEARWPTAGALLEALESYALDHKLAMSPQGLSRFIKELFGERPEPWLDLAEPVAAAAAIGPIGHVSLKHDLEDERVAVTESMVSPRKPTSTVETVADTAPPRRAPEPVSQSVIPTRVRKRRWPYVVAMIAISAAAGGVLAVRTATKDDPDPAPAPVSDSVPAPAPAPAPAPPVVPPETQTQTPSTSTSTTTSTTTTTTTPTASTGPATEKRPRSRKPARVEVKQPPVEAPTEKPAAATPPGRDPTILIRPSQKKDPTP